MRRRPIIGRILPALAAAIALAGAGPFTDRLSPDALRHIRTVAVISEFGDTFQFERTHAGDRFGPPDAQFREISDWNIDRDAANVVSVALARNFTVKQVGYDPSMFSTWDYTILQRSVLDLNADPAMDAYVLVLRDWRPDDIAGSGHDLGGLGLYRRDGGHTAVFACYRIVVVDALTGETIASRAALLPDGKLPFIPVAASLWPKTPNNLTQGQAAALLADEKKLIDATLTRTLVLMRLTR